MERKKKIGLLLVIVFLLLGAMTIFVFFYVVKPVREITHSEYNIARKLLNENLTNTSSFTNNNDKEIVFLSKDLLRQIHNLNEFINSNEVILKDTITKKVDLICERINTLIFFFEKNKEVSSLDSINTHIEILCQKDSDINFAILPKED